MLSRLSKAAQTEILSKMKKLIDCVLCLLAFALVGTFFYWLYSTMTLSFFLINSAIGLAFLIIAGIIGSINRKRRAKARKETIEKVKLRAAKKINEVVKKTKLSNSDLIDEKTLEISDPKAAEKLSELSNSPLGETITKFIRSGK